MHRLMPLAAGHSAKNLAEDAQSITRLAPRRGQAALHSLLHWGLA